MSVIRIMNGDMQSSSQDDVQVIQADLSHLTLNSLVDVTYTTPGVDTALVYDTGTGKFTAQNSVNVWNVDTDSVTRGVTGFGYYGGGPFSGDPQLEIEPYDPDQTTLKWLMRSNIPAPTTAAQPQLGIVTKFQGTDQEIFLGQTYWQHRLNGKDRFEVAHISDDGTASNRMFSLRYNDQILLSRTDFATGLDWSISPDGTIRHYNNTDMLEDLNVAGLTQVGKIIMNTADTDINSILNTTSMDLSDTQHNHVRMTMDYGTNTVPNNAQGSITFSTKDDVNLDRITGRMSSTFRTNDLNEFKIEASDNNGNFESLSINVENASSSVPFQLANYTVANLPTAQAVGSMAFCTDETSGSIPVFWDGTNWRRTTDRAIAS